MKVEELDYVILNDGRKGTIVHVYTKPRIAYEIEFDGGKGETETIEADQVVKKIA